MKSIAFFNNKGGVGKTSLVYHLAWMFSRLGVRVIAADLDPQANLTSMFFDEHKVDLFWNGDQKATIHHALRPLIAGTGDIMPIDPQDVTERLSVIPGDLALSEIEDDLSVQWSNCLDGKERAFRVETAFFRLIEAAGKARSSELALIDVGPNLGAINRAALLAADYVVIPLAPDLFSLQGLRNVGPRLREWSRGWSERLEKAPKYADISLPQGQMQPIGYVVSRHSTRESRPVKAFKEWFDKIPGVYAESVLGEKTPPVEDMDRHRLAQLKDYRSLMPLAQEARKPMFLLKPGDGAIGAHQQAVFECGRDFEALSRVIAGRICLTLAA